MTKSSCKRFEWLTDGKQNIKVLFEKSQSHDKKAEQLPNIKH